MENKQYISKNVIKTATFLALVFLSCLLLFSFIYANKPVVEASQNMFTVSTGDYEVGTWSKKDVVVTAVARPDYTDGKIYYSVNNPYDFEIYENEFVVNTDGVNIVNFKFEHTVIEGHPDIEFFSLEIKVDKTPPVVEKVVLSEEDFTQNPVTLSIFIADSSAYKEEYRAEIFGEVYHPLSNYLENGQIVFEYVAERNTVLNIGDIKIFDQAGNKLVYNEKIEINNIDNSSPDFHLNIINKNYRQKEIEIKLGYIHSQAKEIIFIDADGNEKKLPVLPVQKVLVSQNGTYIVKVTSHSETTLARGVIINNIKKPNLTILYFVILVIGLSVVGVFIARKLINKNNFIKEIN